MRRRNSWQKHLFGAVCLFLILGASGSASAIKLEVSEDKYVKLHYLLQPFIRFTYDTKDGVDPAFNQDMYIRRSRIILGGKVAKWISFFMETDQFNWGKDGKWNTPFIVQDAFVRFHLHEAFSIAVGMIIPPFVRNFFTSSVTLHNYDYHWPVGKYGGGTMVWRDTGLLITGLMANKKLEYRLAILTGIADTPDDVPRITARVSYNIFDPEGDLFPAGTYLGKKKVFAIGVAVDSHKDGSPNFVDAKTGKAKYYADYTAVAGDVFWDIPMGGSSFTGTLAFLYWHNGGWDPTNRNKSGIGMYFDTGFNIGNKIEPIISVNWFKPRDSNEFQNQMLNIHPGLNYWLLDYNANIKLDVGLQKPVGREFADLILQTTIQTQLFF